MRTDIDALAPDSEQTTISPQTCVLGCIAQVGEVAIGECLNQGLDENHFSGSHKAIWRAALELYETGRPLDLFTLLERLCDPHIENIVHACIDRTPDTTHLPVYIDAVKSAALLDHCQGLSHELTRRIKRTKPGESHGLLEWLRDRCWELAAPEHDRTPLPERAEAAVLAWEKRQPGQTLDWPLGAMNEHMTPLARDLMYVIGQRSVGKTALALQMTLLWTMSQPSHKIAWASLENPYESLVQRAIAHLGNLNTTRLRRGAGEADEYARAHKAASQFSHLPIIVHDHGMSMEQVGAWARRAVADGAQVLVIDTLRDIRPTARYANLVERFQDYSMRLKHLARDLKRPFLVLHHESRQTGGAAWSTDIENDADKMIFLSLNEGHSIAPAPDNDYVGRFIVDIEVRKDREGLDGMSFTTEFKKREQRFVEWNPETEAQDAAHSLRGRSVSRRYPGDD